MLRGWLARGIDSADVRVVEPFDAAAEALRSELSVPVVSAATDLDPGFAPDRFGIEARRLAMHDT